MSLAPPIDVQKFINSHKLSAVQIITLLLCFFIVAVDGFDTAAIGFIAPAIRAEWSLSPAQLAPVFGAGLAGLMAGAFLFGPLADRFGRKTILLVCVAFFGAASLVSAYSTSLDMLIVLRFLTGLGLGGAMPNSVTLSSEYAPEKHRSVLVTTMFCGFTLGSALGGVADYGWRAVLVIGGVLPLALVPLLWLVLPESVRYLVMKGIQPEQVRHTLQRIAPDEDLSQASFCVPEKAQTGFPVKHLFDPALRRGTLLLWLTFFMSLLVIYLLSSWLPTLIKSTGRSLKDASLVTAMFQIGGTVGAIGLGQLMDRFNPQRVLGLAYLLAAFFVALIGSSTASTPLLVLAVFGAGICISGAQVGANALSAGFYPTASRATGVSWASGIGRIGSVLGSMAGGWMLALGWSLPVVFAAVGVPALVAAFGITLMGRASPVVSAAH